MAGLTSAQRAKLDAQLEKWQKDLVNLTRKNRLLYFKHTKSSSLEILEPGMQATFDRLDRGAWRFVRPPDTEIGEAGKQALRRGADELLTSKQTVRELTGTLRQLERAASQAFLDTGLWILYTAYGVLRWNDPADGKVVESPLLLRPVRLHRPGSPSDFVLEADEGDLVVNPALALKLANDFGIELPPSDDMDEVTPASVADVVRTAVRKKTGWEVQERTILTTFTFHKEAMYRDLTVNAERIAAHPLVQLAAVGPQAGSERFTFQPVDDDRLDALIAPEDLVSIRDADSTQRKCILAARDGKSFVMDGPPGTGKSQTIANIIAELLHAGKSVLFVSEKAAALDVVHNRLCDASLGEFVLPLHSHKATRKDVAVSLGVALETRPTATAAFNSTDRSKLVRLRKELSEYAVAMNEVRSPLGRSLHDALGRVVQLQRLPHAPAAGVVGTTLSAADMAEIQDAADRLSRAWGPISRRDRFLWRSLRDTSLSAARLQQIERQLDDSLRAVEALDQHLIELQAVLGLDTGRTLVGARRLVEVLHLLEANPNRQTAPVAWFLEPMDELRATLDDRRRSASEYHAAARRLSTFTTFEHGHVDLEAGSRFCGELDRYRSHVAEPPIGLGPSWLGRAQRRSEEALEVLGRIDADARLIADAFSLPRPTTVDRCVELAELAGMIGSATPPEPEWLNPLAEQALVEAEATMTSLLTRFQAERTSLRDVFADSVLDLDLVALKARITSTSGLAKLGGGYRSDKQHLAAHTVTGKVTKTVLARLDDAIGWQDVRDRLHIAEGSHAPALRSYYRGPLETDVERLQRAISLARRALALAGRADARGLAGQLGFGASPDAAVKLAGERLATELAAWQVIVTALEAELSATLPSDIAVLEETLRTVVDAIAAMEPLCASLTRGAIGEVSIASIEGTARAASDARSAADELSLTHDDDRRRFGDGYEGSATDFDELDRDLRWAEALQRALPSISRRSAAERILTTQASAAGLQVLLDAVLKAWSPVADLFDQPARDVLEDEFSVSLPDGALLLGDLRNSTGDIDEWCRYAIARRELADLGLTPAIEFAESNGVAASDLPGVLERAVLEGWCDAVMAGDERLKTRSPSERDALVDQFRQLDRLLVANAAARVINECSARRPSTTVGAAGVIRREAQKKTRHRQIKELLAETREVALALKPCFMMSPLSVSQYLPSDLVFDVVIFDEASQVRPADAVNSVYRGRQLIVAGDPKQLPPTSFFEHLTDEGADDYDEQSPEDFESVLDIFLGSGLPQLPLQWHYRSQHEALITYSNYRFYRGKLHTFPGAIELAHDVGVELFKVAGVYRRGGARDNPIEAAAVVDRVLFHRRHHPHLTLGVVAFSSAQESAILADIERRLDDEPELRTLANEDRLDGFFVKNLENVQGDERDIIIFSIGYGPDENGKFTEQLGPLGKAGGERRLNVAITRARRRVEVVSSVSAADFPGTSAAAGTRHLQRYLDFAERGTSALALDLEQSGGDVESPFEEEVLQVIRGFGFEATPQVGAAGYRIDIGVRRPDRPGEFVLGVECDGAAYHSSRVARDRDRLRQQVLEQVGWTIHRIWGPAWFHDRIGQEAKLKAAIEAAVAGRPKIAPAKSPAPRVEIEEVDLDEAPDWTVIYEASNWKPRRWTTDLHLVAQPDLVQAVVAITDDEGPVHIDVVRRRIADAFGVRRIGSRIQSALDEAMHSAQRSRKVSVVDEHFLTTQRAAEEVAIRVPDPDDERTQRPVAQVPSIERQAAIVAVVERSRRVHRSELQVAFARLFGWRRVGADIEAAFADDLDRLLDARTVAEDSDGYVSVA
jgi:hypothetical protein